MEKTLRNKITGVERRIGNFFYDGLGDLLATEVSSKGAVGLGLAGVIGLSACAGRDLSRLVLMDRRIKVENSLSYGKSERLLHYINGDFTTYTTEDKQALVFDDPKDNYILRPFPDATRECAGENKLEIVTNPYKILDIGRGIPHKHACLNDIKVLTYLAYCLRNKEGHQTDVIGYTFLSPEKDIEVEEILPKTVEGGSIRYTFNFRIKNKKKIFRYDDNGGDDGGPDNGDTTGGAGGSGGDGADSDGGGGGGGGGGRDR